LLEGRTGGKPLRVAIDARFLDGHQGGVQQTVIGLASGLARLDGPEHYLFLVYPGREGWLRPHLGENSSLLPVRSGRTRPLALLAHARAPVPLRRAIRALFQRMPVRVPRSDGTIEEASADVMHFTQQAGFLSGIPSIYVPQDLQHVHLPELFTPFELRWRNITYSTLARRAAITVAQSQFGRDDLIRNLGLESGRVRIIPYASVLETYPDATPEQIRLLRERLGTEGPFALYPAQTWPHKNHGKLLEALAHLRGERATVVRLVLTGRQNDFFPEVRRRVDELGLGSQVRFLGYVEPAELKALYRMARILVVPSLFEGFGMPVIEAFGIGLPVACSRTPALAETADEAALLFDPEDVHGMASAILRLWAEEDLRRDLVARGRERARNFSWNEVALRYRELYREAASEATTTPNAAG
jgi:glycosyltransferase involved in cell wall biosynthesis